jgi:hypothetical protein
MPRRLFNTPAFLHAGVTRGWDILRGGQHFLLTKFAEPKPNPVTEMIVVQDWFEELKRLAPTVSK